MLRGHLRAEVLRRLPHSLPVSVHDELLRQVLHRLRKSLARSDARCLILSSHPRDSAQDDEGYWTPDPDTLDGKCGYGFVRKSDDSGAVVSLSVLDPVFPFLRLVSRAGHGALTTLLA